NVPQAEGGPVAQGGEAFAVGGEGEGAEVTRGAGEAGARLAGGPVPEGEPAGLAVGGEQAAVGGEAGVGVHVGTGDAAQLGGGVLRPQVDFAVRRGGPGEGLAVGGVRQRVEAAPRPEADGAQARDGPLRKRVIVAVGARRLGLLPGPGSWLAG